ncbi:MAG: glycosyltransferase [Burkholderiales bacterium]|nr:glycosyltransferase [Burkholderiales bacterium]
MKISIILATYNWSAALDIILARLNIELNKYNNVELIIADDGSNNTTADVIAKYKLQMPNLHHVWQDDDGFRKSIILNKAVAQSSGEYLLFLDGDCIPFPDYIAQQLKLIEGGYFIAGNRVLLSKSFSQEILHNPRLLDDIFNWNILQWLKARALKKVNKILPSLRLGRGKWRYCRDMNWKYPKGCNFSVWRKDFIAVNGFDESFSGWGHEDAELFVRLLHSGIKIKDGRFAIPVLHLWHEHASRHNAGENSNRLMQRLNNYDFKFAVSGISNYL